MKTWARVRIFVALAIAVLCCGLCCDSSHGQGSPDPGCTLTPPSFTGTSPNIFSDEQEQILGDALAEMTEADLKLAPLGDDDQLTRIGERLLAALPPTKLHYRFRVYDSGEINAFSLGGGRVYISRKLIAATVNEDELAGVVAHEIGHISTHQFGMEFTKIFRVRLGVTQVTDRADIFAKVHLMLSTPAKPGEAKSDDQKDQLLADHAALYAMVRAGYAVESFASFMDKSMSNKGKTGNWLTDMLGSTRDTNQRYRSGLKLISELPSQCKGKAPAKSDIYLAWRKSLVEERVQSASSNAEGEKRIKLDPPLRASLWRIRYSQDGRYIAAQDEASIAIIDKQAQKVLFRVDAPDASGVEFTPDSQNVMVYDSKLRVERWDIATGKRISVKEMVVFEGCYQTMLSLDGKTLVCANFSLTPENNARIGLRLIDVDSGETLFNKPKFYDSGAFNAFNNAYSLYEASLLGGNVCTMDISPDGKYLLVAASSQVQAFDLEHRTPISLGGGLRGLTDRRMSFFGVGQILVFGEPDGKGMYHAKIMSFPDGRVLKEVLIPSLQIRSVTKGELLIAEPIKDFAVGLLDPVARTFVAESKLPAIDSWDGEVAVEDAAGGIMLGKSGEMGTKRIPLTIGQLPTPRAAEFSPDGKYLAVSVKNRAEVWNLGTGKQVGLIRPFRSAWFDHGDLLYGQFPKFSDKEASNLQISMSPFGGKSLAKYEKDEWQYQSWQITFKPMGKGKDIRNHVSLEVKMMDSQTVAWSHDFPHEAPACWPAEDERLVLAWDLTNDAVKGELQAHPGLQREIDALGKDGHGNKKRGLLIETVAPKTGAALEQVVIPEADLSHGWNDERRAMVSGEFVLARGEHGNTVIYRLGDGSKVGEFFGSAVATDSGAGLIAATNRADEILLVDETSGKEIKRLTLGSPVRLARIVIDQEKALMVLTADQVVHRLPLPSPMELAASR